MVFRSDLTAVDQDGNIVASVTTTGGDTYPTPQDVANWMLGRVVDGPILPSFNPQN